MHKVDRSVSGLVARQQCVGPLQLPLADCAVLAHSHFDTRGFASAVAEAPIVGLLSTAAMARRATAELLTNLCWARVSARHHVKLSANWMWAAKLAGEGARMYAACEALRDALVACELAVDGGKDSLSMAADTASEDGVVKAPGMLTLTACVRRARRRASARAASSSASVSLRAPPPEDRSPSLSSAPPSLSLSQVRDVPRRDRDRDARPQARGRRRRALLRRPLDRAREGRRRGRARRGPARASARRRSRRRSARSAPRRATSTPTRTARPGSRASRPRSTRCRRCSARGSSARATTAPDGGLIVTLLEMAFAGDCGFEVTLPRPGAARADAADGAAPAADDAAADLATLFNEEAGFVLEAREADAAAVLDAFASRGVACARVGRTTAAKRCRARAAAGAGGPRGAAAQQLPWALDEEMVVLRDEWEATGFALEALQRTPACARRARRPARAQAARASALVHAAADRAPPPRRRGGGGAVRRRRRRRGRRPRGRGGRGRERAARAALAAPSSGPGAAGGLVRVAVVRQEGTNGDREMCAAFHAARLRRGT